MLILNSITFTECKVIYVEYQAQFDSDHVTRKSQWGLVGQTSLLYIISTWQGKTPNT